MIEQDDLNAEMTELGLGRYNAQVESARKYEQNARSKAGQRLMRELLPKFYERVEEMIARTEGRPTRWLNDLKNYSAKKTAFIAFKNILNCIPYKKTFTLSVSLSAVA